MPEPHAHDHVRIRQDYADPHGRPVDHALLGRLVSALMDECDTCSELAVVFLAEDPVSTVRLIELAYMSLLRREGDPLAPGTARRLPLPAPLQTLFTVGAQEGSEALVQHCREISAAERRSAAISAVSIMLYELSIELKWPQ